MSSPTSNWSRDIGGALAPKGVRLDDPALLLVGDAASEFGEVAIDIGLGGEAVIDSRGTRHTGIEVEIHQVHEGVAVLAIELEHFGLGAGDDKLIAGQLAARALCLALGEDRVGPSRGIALSGGRIKKGAAPRKQRREQ